MKLRSRLDVFRAALLSALGATQLVACGGTAVVAGGDPMGTGTSGSGSAGAGTAGSAQGGASPIGTAGSAQGGLGPTTGNAGASANPFPCMNPQDLGNGLVQCDGFKHRAEPRLCASRIPRPEEVPDHSLGMTAKCKFDADCKDKPHGWCSNVSQSGGSFCEYGCVRDSDCADNSVCDCGDPVGRCVRADCKSDADCKDGFLCKAYDSTGGCGLTTYSCQSPADACGSDADCGDGHCRRGADGTSFQCVPGICAIGRPFLVEGAVRLAPSVARADWHELSLLPRLSELDAALSAQLAEQWTRIALMEHASIAAFARFTLQLMSLGAPASLIERATAAMVDETKHAKACFAVAGSYAATPLGPGRLDVERSLDESSLQEIVLNAIREGCVGETVAAIEAREAAEHALDPALRELLLVIAEDETRHAQLAYRFVQWALELGGPELERAVRREFAELAAEPPPAPRALTDSDHDLLRHGIVPEAMRQAIRGQAMEAVILPCSRALVLPTEARTPRGESAYS
jgi:hypothetical protein